MCEANVKRENSPVGSLFSPLKKGELGKKPEKSVDDFPFPLFYPLSLGR